MAGLVPNPCVSPLEAQCPCRGEQRHPWLALGPWLKGVRSRRGCSSPRQAVLQGGRAPGAAQQGRAGHTSPSLGPGVMPRAGGRAQPDQDRAQPNSSKAKPWGGGCGGDKTRLWELGWGRLQHLEGPGKVRGANCLRGSPGHPSWVSQQQEQGVLCLGVLPCIHGVPLTPGCSPASLTVPCTSGSFLHLGLSQALHSSHGRISRVSLSLQGRHPKAHPVVAQCPHHSGDPGSATQCWGLADGDPSHQPLPSASLQVKRPRFVQADRKSVV